jgi:hypothetical protein
MNQPITKTVTVARIMKRMQAESPAKKSIKISPNQKDIAKETLPPRGSKKTGITVALWRTTNIPEY